MPIDYAAAEGLLREVFAEVQPLVLAGTEPPVTDELKPHFNIIFATNVQAYREALLGCAIALPLIECSFSYIPAPTPSQFMLDD